MGTLVLIVGVAWIVVVAFVVCLCRMAAVSDGEVEAHGRVVAGR